MPRPSSRGPSRAATGSRLHSTPRSLEATSATPGPDGRDDSSLPLREPRPARPAGPAAQASPNPGLAQPRAAGNKGGGGGPGVEPRVGARAWASLPPPPSRPHATPAPSPRAAHPRGRRLRFLPATARLSPSAFLKPLLLPPLPPPRREGARPRPRRERSRRTGARAARALGTAR